MQSSSRSNLEGERSKVLMKNSWIHSFCVAKQREMGVKIKTNYFNNSETSFCNLGSDRLIISHKISGVMLS